MGVNQNVKKPKAPIKNYKSKLAVKEVSPQKKFDVRVILFFITVIIAYIVFFNNFNSLPELTNNYLKTQAGWIRSVQILLYTLVTLIFAFAGYLYITQRELKKKYIFLITLFATIVILMLIHAVAFNAAFEDVDDNASYMIAAKSLVERGAPYYLYLPDAPPDTDSALGLPILLIPFYLMSGMNTVVMEWVIYFVAGLSLLAVFFFFKHYTDKYLALMLTILFGIHPYIVAFSSIVMTEIPYIFWSMLSLFLVWKYHQAEKFSIILLVLLIISVFMTYLTRAVGAGAIVAFILFMFIKSGVVEYIKTKNKKFYKDVRFKKFIFLSLVLFVLLVLWQIIAKMMGGPSQAESFLAYSGLTVIKENLNAIWMVLSQNLFAGALVRKGIEPLNAMWILIFLIVMAGMIIDLIKNQLLALYTLCVMLILILANSWFQPPVVSRYLIIFTPIFIYFFFLAIKTLFRLFGKKLALGAVAGAICLALILPSSLTGTSWYVQQAHTGQIYTPAYGAFIECAQWAKDNLPEGANVASRKERIFYIYSEKCGIKHTGYRDRYSPEFEQKKLAEFKEKKITHLILDTFNGSTIQNIFPIVEHNPDKFKLIKTFGDPKIGPCYVFELTY